MPRCRSAIRPSISLWFAFVAILLTGACSGDSGCGGCGSTTPLPKGGLPADQTVEGGAQIRVTPAGMGKIQTLARTMVEEQLAEGFCIPPTEIGDADGTLGTGAFLCQGNQNQCRPGCDTDIHIDSVTIAAAGTQTLRLRAQVDATAVVPANYQVVGIGGSCNVTVTANNVVVTADIGLGINGTTGELVIGQPQVPRPNLSVSFANCGLASSLLNLFSGFFTSYIADAVVNTLRPTLEALIRDLLPDPLGINGAIDLNSMLAGLTSSPTTGLEARILPGGYVHFTTANGGLSLGGITAFNTDRDPSTRSPDLDSEVARCVPALPPPDFTKAPHTLPSVPGRNTFALPPAGPFDGGPDPANADLAIGLSETTLDLLGHHLVTSGAMCLGLGTTQVTQLNLGTFGIVSPSLAALGSEKRNDPMLLVTRPTQAVDFAIGEGTMESPRLTMKVKDLDIDVYAFLYERYVRAFTITISIDLGLNLELEQTPGNPVTIKPVLVGVSSKNARLDVSNTQFVREKKEDILAILPVVIDLATAALGDLPSITVPAFAGFSLENLAVGKVVTTEDAFLSVTGNLGTQTNPALAAVAARAAAKLGTAQLAQLAAVSPSSPREARGDAKLAHVSVPPLDEVREALEGKAGSALPSVTFEVSSTDELGRELEWSWRLDHGLWRPYGSAGAQLVISDRAFAFQGDYTISLRARAKGDFRTASAECEFAVRIDSVAPHLVSEELKWSSDGGLSVMGFDVVAKQQISIAFGRPGEDEPATAWTEGDLASLDAAAVRSLARDGEVVVFLRDPTGNTAVELVSPSSGFHGKAESGCNCDSSGGPSSGGVALMIATSLLLLSRRQRGLVLRAARSRHARGLGAFLLLSVATSMMPACDCGGAEGRACEVVQDCAGLCTESGKVPFCLDGACICSDDVPPGKIGPYADIGVSNNGVAWVVAYAQTHGDLVAIQAKPGRVKAEDWEWVDGVPDGPVVIENAKIRHGIEEDGDDVGMYPSVAVTAADLPVVSYFDRETASLRFTARDAAGVWTSHVVDAGTGSLTGAAGALVGMYTSITVRADDGRPGIAYLAHVKDENGTRAEVRYASAQVPDPKVAADWQIKVVDQAPQVMDPNNPNLYPLPEGLGLFIDSGRMPNQAPVVVYYDRSNGALKMAVFNPTTGNFVPSLIEGGANNDAGWSPSVTVDSVGKVHIAYVSAARDDLSYTRVVTAPQVRAELTEVADDGYREDGVTSGGLPKPTFHFVGDDASLIVSLSGVPVITYQDSTTHELLIARRTGNGTWSRSKVAGGVESSDGAGFEGAYGFFAASAATSSTLYIANWVLDPANDEQWVEVFERPVME